MMFPMNWFMLSFFILIIPHLPPYGKKADAISLEKNVWAMSSKKWIW